MENVRQTLYEQIARIGKVLASPKRLELIDHLCQGEKTVEALAAQSQISVKLASAHLKELRMARLVETRKDGTYVLYRLAGTSVADLWLSLRAQAQERLLEFQAALESLSENQDDLKGVDRGVILEKARSGELVVLDLRPGDEFSAGHLPKARSIPFTELKRRLSELPKDLPVVAYCRGPFCVMGKDAVNLLRRKGYRAFHLSDGIAEWRARGMPVEA